MTLDLFAGLGVRSRDVAVEWYTAVLGAEPSFFPNDVEAVWELGDHQFVYVDAAAGHAGHSAVTLFVDDLDERVAAIAARGIEPAEQETYDNGVRKVLYRDPDGNEVGFGGGPTDG